MVFFVLNVKAMNKWSKFASCPFLQWRRTWGSSLCSLRAPPLELVWHCSSLGPPSGSKGAKPSTLVHNSFRTCRSGFFPLTRARLCSKTFRTVVCGAAWAEAEMPALEGGSRALTSVQQTYSTLAPFQDNFKSCIQPMLPFWALLLLVEL